MSGKSGVGLELVHGLGFSASFANKMMITIIVRDMIISGDYEGGFGIAYQDSRISLSLGGSFRGWLRGRNSHGISQQ